MIFTSGTSGEPKAVRVTHMTVLFAGTTLMATQPIREDDARGRHTTTHRQLVLLPNGRLVLGVTHPPLWGAVIVFVLAARGVNLLVSVAVAVAVVALLRALG